MNFKPSNLGIIVLVFYLYSCSSSGSKESTTSQDTLTTNKTDSIPASQPLVVSQAEFSTLEEKLKDQFEKVYKDIVDTANYIKVTFTDNYNEYEGQNEATEIELYFDKTFSLRYYKEIYETGVVGSSEIKEYIIDNRTIVWGREKHPYDDIDFGEKYIIQWSDQPGVIKSNTSRFGETTYESVQDRYKIEKFETVEAKLSSITDVLNEGEISRETEYSYSVIIKESKENDLIDSTKVIVPKILYKQLKDRP